MKVTSRDLFLLMNIVSMLLPSLTLAQSSGADPQIEEMIVIGTRRAEQALEDAPVPVDVIQGDELMSQGSTDLDDLLRTATLSYNVQRHAIDDEATLVRGATAGKRKPPAPVSRNYLPGQLPERRLPGAGHVCDPGNCG